MKCFSMFGYILFLLVLAKGNSEIFVPDDSSYGPIQYAQDQNPNQPFGAIADSFGKGSLYTPPESQYSSYSYQEPTQLGQGNVMFPPVSGEQDTFVRSNQEHVPARLDNMVFRPVSGEQHILVRPNQPLVPPYAHALDSRPVAEEHFLTRPLSVISTWSGPQNLPHRVSPYAMPPPNHQFPLPGKVLLRPQIVVNAKNIFFGGQRFERETAYRYTDSENVHLQSPIPERYDSAHSVKSPSIYQWLANKLPSVASQLNMKYSTEIAGQKFEPHNLKPVSSNVLSGYKPMASTQTASGVLGPHNVFFRPSSSLVTPLAASSATTHSVTTQPVDTASDKHSNAMTAVKCDGTSPSLCLSAVSAVTKVPIAENITDNNSEASVDDVNTVQKAATTVGQRAFMPLLGLATGLLDKDHI